MLEVLCITGGKLQFFKCPANFDLDDEVKRVMG